MWGNVEREVAGKAGSFTAQRERLRNEPDKSTTPRHAILAAFMKTRVRL
jgi:hypothetical protein